MKFDQTAVFPDSFTEEMRTIASQAGAGQAGAQFALGELYAEGDGVFPKTWPKRCTGT